MTRECPALQGVAREGRWRQEELWGRGEGEGRRRWARARHLEMFQHGVVPMLTVGVVGDPLLCQSVTLLYHSLSWPYLTATGRPLSPATPLSPSPTRLETIFQNEIFQMSVTTPEIHFASRGMLPLQLVAPYWQLPPVLWSTAPPVAVPVYTALTPPAGLVPRSTSHTVRNCTELHCTSLLCTAPHCVVLYCATLHCTAL